MKNKKHLKGKRILAFVLGIMLIMPYFSMTVSATENIPVVTNENDDTDSEIATVNNSHIGNADNGSTTSEVDESVSDTDKEKLNVSADTVSPQPGGSSGEQPQDIQNISNKSYTIEEFKEFFKVFKELEEKNKKENEQKDSKKQENVEKEKKPVIANGSYVIDTECFKYENDKPSMANDMFSPKADLIVNGENSKLIFYIASPVPAFPNSAPEGSVRDFYIEYNGQKYNAVSDNVTKPLKPMRNTNPEFGLVKDKAIPTQVLSIDIPTSVFTSKEIMLKAGCYVNVVMKSDVELRIKLSNIPADDRAMQPLFMVDGKEVMVPNWLVGMLKSGKLLANSIGNNQANGTNNTKVTTSANTNNSTTLSDGVYAVNGNILKANGSSTSMANDAIEHTMYITVKNGKAHLIVTFKGLAMDGRFGYLGYLNYYESMSSDTPYKSEVLSRQTANGVVVSDTYGTNYPKDIIFPLPGESMNTGKIAIQVFVPIMEAISAGNGTQKAVIEIAVNNLQKIGDNADSFISSKKEGAVNTNNTQNKNNNELKLNDGVYKVNVSMIKTDKSSLSMANNSINHIAKLKVSGNKYYLTIRFNPMNVGGKLGYLGKLKYYTPSYTLNNGDITGSLSDAKIEEYHTMNGKNVSDTYGTDYPKACTVELIESARKDGFVALNVFVPIMDKISPGSGSQNVFAKLDISNVNQTTESDPDFVKEENTLTTLPVSDNTNNTDTNESVTDEEMHENKKSENAIFGDAADKVVTQYVSVPSNSSAPVMASGSEQNSYLGAQGGYYGVQNPYYNPYMMSYNPYYNPYAYYQNPYYAATDSQAQGINNKNGSLSVATTISIIFGGVSGFGAALGYIFRKLF